MTKEIQRIAFDKAEENMTRKGTFTIIDNVLYGFYVNNDFYYTISNRYYKISK